MGEGLLPVDQDWHNCDYEIKEQDRYLPIANVARVMKKALPDHAKLSKESKECIQECVSEFISFITSQAVDKCGLEKRKTINGEDILWAMYSLGFENYSETLKIYLTKYRQFEQIELEKKPVKKRQRRRTKPKPVIVKEEEDGLEDEEDEEEEEEEDIRTGNSEPFDSDIDFNGEDIDDEDDNDQSNSETNPDISPRTIIERNKPNQDAVESLYNFNFDSTNSDNTRHYISNATTNTTTTTTTFIPGNSAINMIPTSTTASQQDDILQQYLIDGSSRSNSNNEEELSNYHQYINKV